MQTQSSALSFSRGATSHQAATRAETGARPPMPVLTAIFPDRAAPAPPAQTEPAHKTDVERQLHALDYIATALRGIDESLASQAKAAENTMRLYGEVVKLLAQLEIRAAARW
jgi:hypothetical protein